MSLADELNADFEEGLEGYGEEEFEDGDGNNGTAGSDEDMDIDFDQDPQHDSKDIKHVAR